MPFLGAYNWVVKKNTAQVIVTKIWETDLILICNMDRNWERSISLSFIRCFLSLEKWKEKEKIIGGQSEETLQIKSFIKWSTHVLKSLTPFLMFGFWQLSGPTPPLPLLALCKKVWCSFLWHPEVRSNHAHPHPHVRMFPSAPSLNHDTNQSHYLHIAQGTPDKCVYLPSSILCEINLFRSSRCMCDIICLDIWSNLREERLIPPSTVLWAEWLGAKPPSSVGLSLPLTCKLALPPAGEQALGVAARWLTCTWSCAAACW